MKEQFVTHEIALRLKKLGFDQKCFAIYDAYQDNRLVYLSEDGRNPSGTIKTNESMDFSCLAPLYQQVIDWFRNRYNLLIDSPKLDVWNIGKWSVKITSPDKSIILEEHVGQPYWRIYRCFRTYEEARENAILKAIELCQYKKLKQQL